MVGECFLVMAIQWGLLYGVVCFLRSWSKLSQLFVQNRQKRRVLQRRVAIQWLELRKMLSIGQSFPFRSESASSLAVAMTSSIVTASPSRCLLKAAACMNA